jgi:uncharacterized YccA/Bax inhibitor family protein
MPLPVRSGNPGLNDRTFSGLPRPTAAGDRMTLQGAINKSFLLLVVLLAGAFYPWSQFAATGDASVVGPTTLIGLVGGLHMLRSRDWFSVAFRQCWSVDTPVSRFRRSV